MQAGFSIVRNRVAGPHGSLAMTRALGDTKYKTANLPVEKQAVTPVPDTTSITVEYDSSSSRNGAGADFMILACDGLWDVVSNQDVS